MLLTVPQSTSRLFFEFIPLGTSPRGRTLKPVQVTPLHHRIESCVTFELFIRHARDYTTCKPHTNNVSLTLPTTTLFPPQTKHSPDGGSPAPASDTNVGSDLDTIIDDLYEKRATTREKAISRLITFLSASWAVEELSDHTETLLSLLTQSIKKGGTIEATEACHAVRAHSSTNTINTPRSVCVKKLC